MYDSWSHLAGPEVRQTGLESLHQIALETDRQIVQAVGHIAAPAGQIAAPADQIAVPDHIAVLAVPAVPADLAVRMAVLTDQCLIDRTVADQELRTDPGPADQTAAGRVLILENLVHPVGRSLAVRPAGRSVPFD